MRNKKKNLQIFPSDIIFPLNCYVFPSTICCNYVTKSKFDFIFNNNKKNLTIYYYNQPNEKWIYNFFPTITTIETHRMECNLLWLNTLLANIYSFTRGDCEFDYPEILSMMMKYESIIVRV